MMMPPMPNRMPQSMPADPAAALPQAGMAGDAMPLASAPADMARRPAVPLSL